jgi:hypothetical protein
MGHRHRHWYWYWWISRPGWNLLYSPNLNPAGRPGYPGGEFGYLSSFFRTCWALRRSDDNKWSFRTFPDALSCNELRNETHVIWESLELWLRRVFLIYQDVNDINHCRRLMQLSVHCQMIFLIVPSAFPLFERLFNSVMVCSYEFTKQIDIPPHLFSLLRPRYQVHSFQIISRMS